MSNTDTSNKVHGPTEEALRKYEEKIRDAYRSQFSDQPKRQAREIGLNTVEHNAPVEPVPNLVIKARPSGLPLNEDGEIIKVTRPYVEGAGEKVRRPDPAKLEAGQRAERERAAAKAAALAEEEARKARFTPEAVAAEIESLKADAAAKERVLNRMEKKINTLVKALEAKN